MPTEPPARRGGLGWLCSRRAPREALLGAGAFCLATAGLASATYQAITTARDRRRYLPPGELVDIGGRRLHLWCAGEGSPAVVVASSLGEPGDGWAEIQRRLAQHATVILYDRAGLGWSDCGPWPTGPRMVADLHALLGGREYPAAICPGWPLPRSLASGRVAR